jgi:DNA-directed RNA polymerase beta subunit
MIPISPAEKVTKIKEWLSKTTLDAEVCNQTIGIPAGSISADVLLQASAKVLKVNKGLAEVDDRDNLKYSRFLNLEDFVKEHIDKDAGRLQQKAKQKIKQKSNLSWMTSGFFTPQVRSTIIGNALSENTEGINPMQIYDTVHKVTKMGEGGIPDATAIPDSSRDVQESSFGFIDPFHVDESEKIGVTGHFTHNVVKGHDGKLYRTMKGQDGKLKWMSHEDILNSTVGIPEY